MMVGIGRMYFAQLRPAHARRRCRGGAQLRPVHGVGLPSMTTVRLTLALLACLLAAPAVAPARVIEIGRANDAEELPEPSCPRSPCFAVSRTTGYQAKVGTNRGLLRVPENGRIVA